MKIYYSILALLEMIFCATGYFLGFDTQTLNFSTIMACLFIILFTLEQIKDLLKTKQKEKYEND